MQIKNGNQLSVLHNKSANQYLSILLSYTRGHER